jgi:asparagine synthase (glutamine-hydrolysing)
MSTTLWWMCGICGVIQVGGELHQLIAPETLEYMTDLMAHRGPNDRGTCVADGAAIGVRRLSIVDVDGGHQPVSNETGSVWAAQNGELYNHSDLREELRREGHTFRSVCDTEILPHLFEREGPMLARSLRGKFAFVVWDAEHRRGVIARDRLGVKPLYYARNGDLLVFASELKSVLASGLVSSELDVEAIESYLALGYFPGPSTPLKDVFKLLPAHCLLIENGSVSNERYWELPFPDPDREGRTDREYADGLIEELDEAVRLRLMSDVPLGAMLSGGLDSSVIVALMARHSSSPVKTFSVAFREDTQGNELSDARLVAAAFGTDHHELELSLRDESMPLEELVWYLDEPLADLSSVGLYALSKLAAEHVTVALSGQGADELLGGYPTHRNAALADKWGRLPGALRRAGSAMANHAPQRYRRAAAAITADDPVARFLAQSSSLDAVTRLRLPGDGLGAAPSTSVRNVAVGFLAGHEGGALASNLYLHQQLGLVDDMLQYFDRASMARSLEVRVPFLDHKVVEYCARVPDRLKVRGLGGKVLLRKAARGLIPDRIIDKPKIGFFSHAVGAWFQEQAGRAVADYLLQSDLACADILDRRAVTALASQASAGDRSTNAILLRVLMLEIWLKSYLPRAMAGVPGARVSQAAPT